MDGAEDLVSQHDGFQEGQLRAGLPSARNLGGLSTSEVAGNERFSDGKPCQVYRTLSKEDRLRGQIAVDGPGTVCYTFLQSTGAMAPVETLKFDAAGTKPVHTDWTLGSYAGWQAIQIVSPNRMESQKASFELVCR